MVNNIYNISNALQNIFYEIEENGGELTPEFEEALSISQKDFKDKVKQYANVIKLINGDCSTIDTEIKRLKAYKESKKKLKERLSKILIKAIDMFGEHTKSGGSYVDLGTEKVSVRNSTKIETYDEDINSIAEETVGAIYSMCYNGTEETDPVSMNSVIDGLKEHVEFDETTGEEYKKPIYARPSNFDDICAKITIDVPINKLFEKEGVDMIHGIMNRTSAISVTGYVDKANLKRELQANEVTSNNIAKITKNQSINIR